MKNKCVQYGVWPNCCNSCSFCLREERIPYSKKQQLKKLKDIKENINHIDWKNEFSCGISLLGGELYHITDTELQESFLDLIDIIIEKILKVSDNPNCKYSTVTNGLYNPTFLYMVIDKIANSVGMDKVDLNFSFDLKYRFKSKEDEQLVLNNINEFHNRYDYCVGVQMILTQYLIDMWRQGDFDVNKFIETYIPGNMLCFLYPHPIHTGLKINDFNFKRNDFFEFLKYLKTSNVITYYSFIHSVKNSATFKYTGLQDQEFGTVKSQPTLSNGKEILNHKCNHSILYQCYSDCDKCMLCDLLQISKDEIL